MSTGRMLAVVALVLSVVLLFLALALPGVTAHLSLWTLILLALLALGVVLG